MHYGLDQTNGIVALFWSACGDSRTGSSCSGCSAVRRESFQPAPSQSREEGEGKRTQTRSQSSGSVIGACPWSSSTV